MSLGTQTISLWRRAGPFRAVTIAAVAMTVLALLFGRGGGPTGSNVQTANTSTSTGGGSSTVNTPPPPPQMVQCGPSGNTQLAAPLVAGSKQPANVTAVAPSSGQSNGVPLAVIGRFNQFFVTVDAAKSEQRRGESCALMSDAVSILEPADFAWASCFQDGQSKLTDAQACTQSHAQSEARYDRLVMAHEAYEQEPSSANIAALAQARTDLNSYDEARERWREVAQILAEAEAASASIARSDARISRLVAASTAAQSGGAPQLEALASASTLEQMDIARLTPEQNRMLEAARSAKSEIQDSDTRLDAIAIALDAVMADDAGSRADLIAAVGALAPLDLARATPQQSESIARAKAEAAAFAVRDLVSEAGAFQAANATADHHQRLIDLADVVTGHGGVAEPTPEQAAALARAQEAAAALARSDRRLNAMSTTMAAVRAGGPSAMGEDVYKIYDAITDFDRSRMNEDQKTDFAALGDARAVKSATMAGKLTRTVPIYLSADGGNGPNDALTDLKNVLLQDGFTLVDTEEASAVHFRLDVGELRKSGLKTAGITVETARIDMRLTGTWTIDQDSLKTMRAEGIGRGRNAEEKAMADAVNKLFGDIAELADNS